MVAKVFPGIYSVGNTEFEGSMIERTTGAVYVAGGKWLKWRHLLELGAPFKFFVKDNNLQLQSTLLTPSRKAYNLLEIPQTMNLSFRRPWKEHSITKRESLLPCKITNIYLL